MDKTLWMARLLYRRGPLTRTEILDAWRDKDDRGRPMAQSTFYDNCKYIRERYGIEIQQHKGLYSLKRNDYKDSDFLLPILNDAPRPTSEEHALRGAQWLPLLEESLTQGNRLRMTYAPLDKNPYETDFSPYCLRQFRRTGYCVGYSKRHQEVRNFALDRIQSLIVLPQHYKIPDNFHETDYFRHSFGIFGGNDVHPEPIVIETDARTATYLKSRPLHESQREIAGSPSAMQRFALEVAPTQDFIAELLSYGPNPTLTR